MCCFMSVCVCEPTASDDDVVAAIVVVGGGGGGEVRFERLQ